MHLVGFIIRVYRDARSPEGQTRYFILLTATCSTRTHTQVFVAFHRNNGCAEASHFYVLRTFPICTTSVHYSKINQGAERFLSLDNNMKLA